MKKTILSCLILIALLLAPTQSKLHEGAKVFELKLETVAQLKLLKEHAEHEQEDFELLNSPQVAAAVPIRVLVQPNGLSAFQDFLQAQNIVAKIIDENFRATIENELNTQRLLRTLKPYRRRQQRLSNERYYSHGEINAYIEDLAQRYPRRAQVKTVGKSYEGRLLKTIRITNGDGRKNKQIILMDGGFHAREWISPAAAVHVIGELVENYANNADLLQHYDWVILPVVNADGYEYTQISADTRMWRKTRQPSKWNGSTVECYGTDPNRNFDFHWNEEGASDNPCSNTYAGPRAFSEPEAMVVRDLIQSFHERGVMYLTLHSHGQLLLYPWGWSSLLPDTWQDLHAVGTAGADAIYAATGTKYTVGSSTNVLYIAAGASDDYAFNAGFLQSFTMELPAGGNSNFDPPPSSIDPYVKETWVGIRAMAKKLQELYPVSHN